jgi:hypothetical protein
MHNIDLYSTHLEFLQTILNYVGKLKFIVEFGMGDYSTEVLLKKSEQLISIEMQSKEWFEKIFKKFSNLNNWKPYELLGPLEFTKLNFDNADLAFVDGHGSTRPECINLMFEKNVPYVIAHDTEESSYGWNRIMQPEDYFKYEFKKFKNWSTLWTIDGGLFNFLLNKYS